MGRSSIALVIYGVLLALTVFSFMRTPTGFVPQQDKLYLVGVAQLPDAASIDRTEEVVTAHERDRAQDAGRRPRWSRSPGCNVNGLVNSPNAAGVVHGA